MSGKRVGPFHSYKSLFKIKHKIYKLGNIHLWGFGVSFDQLATGAVAGIFLWLLYTIFPLLNLLPLNKWVAIIAGSIAAAWASARYELGGKSILAWTVGIVMWLFRSKYSVRGMKMAKPVVRKEPVYFRAACRVVSVSETGVQRCMSPCIVEFDRIDYIDISSPHKLMVKPSGSVVIHPKNKKHKDAVQHEDMIFLPKNKTSTVHTPDYPVRIENVQILSQPAPSPDKVRKFKPPFSLAWYVEKKNT